MGTRNYARRRADRAGGLPFVLTRPMCWPRWLRRLFLLMLPISAIVWLSLGVGTVMCLALWKLLSPILRFWNAPRRRYYSPYGYPYPRRSRLPGKESVSQALAPAE